MSVGQALVTVSLEPRASDSNPMKRNLKTCCKKHRFFGVEKASVDPSKVGFGMAEFLEKWFVHTTSDTGEFVKLENREHNQTADAWANQGDAREG